MVCIALLCFTLYHLMPPFQCFYIGKQLYNRKLIWMNWITFRFVIFYCDDMFEWVIFHHFFFLSKIYLFWSSCLCCFHILCMRVYDSVSMGLGFSVSNDNNDYIKSIAKFGVVVENRFPRIHFFLLLLFYIIRNRLPLCTLCKFKIEKKNFNGLK